MCTAQRIAGYGFNPWIQPILSAFHRPPTHTGASMGPIGCRRHTLRCGWPLRCSSQVGIITFRAVRQLTAYVSTVTSSSGSAPTAPTDRIATPTSPRRALLSSEQPASSTAENAEITVARCIQVSVKSRPISGNVAESLRPLSSLCSQT